MGAESICAGPASSHSGGPISGFPQDFLSLPPCVIPDKVAKLHIPYLRNRGSHETQKGQQPGVFNLRAGCTFLPVIAHAVKARPDFRRGKLTLPLERTIGKNQ